MQARSCISSSFQFKAVVLLSFDVAKVIPLLMAWIATTHHRFFFGMPRDKQRIIKKGSERDREKKSVTERQTGGERT